MTLSKKHYLLVKDGEHETFHRKMSDDIQVGDIVLHTNGKNEYMMEGTFTMIEPCVVQRAELMLVWTTSMKIVVNNIASSCHIDKFPICLVNATVQVLQCPYGQDIDIALHK